MLEVQPEYTAQPLLLHSTSVAGATWFVLLYSTFILDSHWQHNEPAKPVQVVSRTFASEVILVDLAIELQSIQGVLSKCHLPGQQYINVS